MTPERWQQVARLFELALEHPLDQRAAYLETACQGDEPLRHDVESLLREDEASLVLDRPVLAAVAPWFDDRPGLEPGTSLGPYRIEAVLGAGGMGEVFRATDTRLGRIVAIKVLPTSIAADRGMRARLAREARAIAALAHPNICTLYDIGNDGGIEFIVMEFVKGETLAARLSNGPLTLDEALDSAIHIASALEHAHRHGIVHRDLKPSNIMITPSGPKLLDFGLAAFRDPPGRIHDLADSSIDAKASSAMRDEGPDSWGTAMLGTVRYMSPEQFERRPVDPRTDLFAFGLVLFEMLTGRRAFDQETAAGVRTAVLSATPLDGVSMPAQVPPRISSIISRCCARDPDHRWGSATDVMRELKQSLPALLNARRSARRLAGSLAMLLAVTCAGLAASLVFDRPPRAQAPEHIRSLAVLPLVNRSARGDQDPFADAMTEQLIEDLAGLDQLRVISSGSVMPYRKTPKPLPVVVRELKVDAVVEGSVTNVDNTIRVTARLVRGPGGEVLWARSYERALADLLSLQSELARNITSELGLILTARPPGHESVARRIDPELHRQVLLGRFHAAKATEAGLLTAVEYFEKVIAVDPTVALAHAGLADAYLGLSGYYRDPREVMPKAKRSAREALALDDTLATVHAALGWIHLVYDWDGPSARSELLRALDLNPTLATARLHYAAYLTTQFRYDDAVAEIRRAFESDPLSVRTNAIGVSLLLFARAYDEAIEMASKGLEFEPNSAFALAFQGVAFAEQGRMGEAVENLTRAAALDSSPTILALQAHVFAIAGRKDEALGLIRQLEHLTATAYFCPYEIGMAHVSLGDHDTADRWFRKGIEGRADCMAWLGVEPWIESFRSDPRYSGLLRAVGLDPTTHEPPHHDPPAPQR